MRRSAFLLAAIALLITCGVLAQEGVGRRPVQARFASGVPRLTVSASDLADDSLRRRLQSGLPQTLATRIYAYQGENDEAAIAIGARFCRITYDPWALSYRVQLQSPIESRTQTIANIDEVIDRCLGLSEIPVGHARDWTSLRGREVWFAVLVELNPLSPETVHRIRRWLSRPDGAAVESDAFFGSFVSLFVNRRIGDAERIFRYRSAERVRCP